MAVNSSTSLGTRSDIALELRGLRWDDVDLAKGIIHVRRGWDDYAGEVPPKSAKGERQVPIAAILSDYLTEQKTRTGRDPGAFLF
jgi:integrase